MPKKENVFSGRALAREIGITEGAIRNAHKRGELRRIKSGLYKGKYDMADEFNKNGVQIILGHANTGDKKLCVHETQVSKKKQQIKNKTEKPETIVFSETYQPSIGIANADINQLKILKEREALKEKQIKNEEARGLLVKRSDVASIFNKLWSVDTSQLIPLPEKIGPELASICGVTDQEIITKVIEKIDAEIWRTLNHCKRIMSGYLSRIGEDGLKDSEE